MEETIDVLEANFINEIRTVMLTFLDPSLESSYSFYKLNTKTLPKPFKYYLISIITIFIARKVQMIISLALDKDSDNTNFMLEVLDAICFSIILIIESLVYCFTKLSYIKGLTFLTFSSFFICWSAVSQSTSSIAISPM